MRVGLTRSRLESLVAAVPSAPSADATRAATMAPSLSALTGFMTRAPESVMSVRICQPPASPKLADGLGPGPAVLLHSTPFVERSGLGQAVQAPSIA
jgi:hypothetical protein